MKSLYSILIILLCFNVSYSQEDIFGTFRIEGNGYIELQLKRDSTFVYQSKFSELFTKSIGVFHLRNDTIVLIPKDKEITKFVIKKYNSSEYFSYEYAIKIKTLINDSIFDGFYLIQLASNGSPFFGVYLKHEKFLINGNIKYKIQIIDKFILVTHYYSNGKIMVIKTYLNGKRNSNWYFFDNNGNINKIEVYKRDRLVNTFIKNWI